jgi:hypothetical protein
VVGEAVGGGLGKFGCEGRRWGWRGDVRPKGKSGENGKKNDLNAGHNIPISEYVRTHKYAFDRTRASE